jgi:OmpA-OmpF porin, OOP family
VTQIDRDINYAAAPTRALRRVRRVEDGYARRPFMPYGLWPVLGLGLLALYMLVFGARGIQDSAERAAQQALNDAGISWAKPVASGQWITLEGSPPSGEDGQRALNVVRNQKEKTFWFGAARPVTRVIDGFGADAAIRASAPAPAGSGNASLDWTFQLANGVLRLEGQVPDEDTRAAIAKAATAAINPQRFRSVENALTVANVAAPEGYRSAALRGVNTLSRCDRGSSRSRGGTFSLTCELAAAAEAGVRSEASAQLPYGQLGAVDIIVTEDIASCEQNLADILDRARIEFGSGSAVITAPSNAVVDRVAEAASACPGTLRIEGHTDNEGSSALNDGLSQRRAQAVRSALINRGLSPERLIAEGFGDRVPIADNLSANGRARNRRIEVRVVRSPT